MGRMTKKTDREIGKKIGELLLVLGTGLFIVGAIGFIAGYLSQEQIPAIAVFALIFIGAGLGMKRRREFR